MKADRRSLPLRLRLALATGLGVGYAPLAPGTAGSLVGLLLVALSWRLGGSAILLAIFAIVLALGLWSSAVAEPHFGRRDPGPVVVDEITGQLLSLLFLPPTAGSLVAGFLLFRLFDIVKPYPVRRLESLPGGSGIMADDLMAGCYANLAQQALRWAFGGWWSGV